MRKSVIIIASLSCFTFQSCKKEKTPVASFTYTNMAMNSSVNELEFTNLSTDADHYKWEISDGTCSGPIGCYSSGDFEPAIKYYQPSLYSTSTCISIKLTAYSASEKKTNETIQYFLIN